MARSCARFSRPRAFSRKSRRFSSWAMRRASSEGPGGGSSRFGAAGAAAAPGSPSSAAGAAASAAGAGAASAAPGSIIRCGSEGSSCTTRAWSSGTYPWVIMKKPGPRRIPIFLSALSRMSTRASRGCSLSRLIMPSRLAAESRFFRRLSTTSCTSSSSALMT